MTNNTIQTTVTLNGDQMKELKSMVTGQKVVRGDDVFNHIKIEVDEGYIVATVANKNYMNRKTIESVQGTGKAFLVPMDLIRKTVRIRKDSIYKFTVDHSNTSQQDDRLSYDDNGITVTVDTLKATEYALEHFKTDEMITVGKLTNNDLASLKKSELSISKLDSRPVLQHAIIRGNKIASTDAHRLYMNKLDHIESERDILINHELLKTILRNEKLNEFTATLKTSNNNEMMIIESEKATYTGFTISQNYPELEKLITQNHKIKFTLENVKQLENILTNIDRLKEGNQIQPINLTIIDNTTLEIHSQSEKGKITEQLSITDTESDAGFAIRFSQEYLIDSLKQLQATDGLVFNLSSPVRPLIMHTESNSDEFVLVSPLRLS